MKKYNLQAIMMRAWALHRKLNISFSESLHRSWLSEKAYPINEQRIAYEKSDTEARLCSVLP